MAIWSVEVAGFLSFSRPDRGYKKRGGEDLRPHPLFT
ncbi:unannotated protein [freshwater metagenome]|uniref:Unannotated protein n=1 Tax=freshwater metagenome TaxID=449393 RepID=A0A6J7GP82_9ZZZZ